MAHMGNRFTLTPEKADWLKANYAKHTNAKLARELGCCVDTVKRAVMRLELDYFPGAKYQHRVRPKTWRRPCMICGSTEEREINQYRCNDCHEREQSSEYHWEDYAEQR